LCNANTIALAISTYTNAFNNCDDGVPDLHGRIVVTIIRIIIDNMIEVYIKLDKIVPMMGIDAMASRTFPKNE
jgi:hypothetical protein